MMDPQELVPLESGLPRPNHRPSTSRNYHLASRSCYRAPLRLCRLLSLLIILPSVFIFVPLYLRYRVFSGQMYPMSMTDMRLIDSKISPTWCQRQVVKSNATFNAFVVPGPPELTENLLPVTMTRELELEDDMKEYWGFYLLKGSSVTVSACVRWPGASLIMIKGYKHLQECAYIGDDSSEELDELLEAFHKGLMSNTTLLQKINELNKEDGKANDPGAMRRHKAGVSFHDPNNIANNTSSSSESVPAIDVTDHDPKELREILERLHALKEAVKMEQMKYFQMPSHLMNLPALHRHRDANVDRDERKWLSFEDIDGNNSEIIDTVNNNTINTHVERKENKQNTTTKELIIVNKVNRNDTVTETPLANESNGTMKDIKLYNTTNKEIALGVNHKTETVVQGMQDIKFHKDNTTKKDIALDMNRKTATVATVVEDIHKEKETTKNTALKVPVLAIVFNHTTTTSKVEALDNDVTTIESSPIEEKGNSEMPVLKEVNTFYPTTQNTQTEQSSREIFEDVLNRLQALGDKGKRVLQRLHENIGIEYKKEMPKKSRAKILSAVTSGEELDRLRQVLVEAIDEEKTKSQRQQKRRNAREDARAKRELMLGQIELKKQFNEDDEARDYAAEEGLEPDGYAEHHVQLNETTAFDMSNSEFWSSFSSSEEALLECEGLILNLPLTPHTACHKGASDEETFSAAKANALTYRVPANGYYFFVFNSENEVQRNYIRAKFDLQKTRYDVARTKLRECTNSTERCDLALDIFSTQKVVLEVPLRDNDSLWNEQFVIISECEPRTSIYMVCVIAVPILIMIFAFQ